MKVYREGVHKLSVNCMREAASRHVRCYVELSTAGVLPSSKVCCSL
jgi:hypothetical protein